MNEDIKRVRKYYKYENLPLIFDFSNSPNQTCVSNNAFDSGSVTQWYTTQTYELIQPINVRDLTTIYEVVYTQANTRMEITVKAVTEEGEEIVLVDRGSGWGGNISDTTTKTFNYPFQTIQKIIIYVGIYRAQTRYCYGQMRVHFTYTSVNKYGKGTPDDYDYFVDEPSPLYAFKIDDENTRYAKVERQPNNIIVEVANLDN